jgi:hypothetical protein
MPSHARLQAVQPLKSLGSNLAITELPLRRRCVSIQLHEMLNATSMQRRAYYQLRSVFTLRGFASSPIPAVGIKPTRAFPPRGF